MIESLQLFYLIVIFIIAIFLGYELITKVPPTLHTPLMSGTNAVSGIIIIGAMTILANHLSMPLTIIATIGLCLATINVIGGFEVTRRMLKMFNQKKKETK